MAFYRVRTGDTPLSIAVRLSPTFPPRLALAALVDANRHKPTQTIHGVEIFHQITVDELLTIPNGVVGLGVWYDPFDLLTSIRDTTADVATSIQDRVVDAATSIRDKSLDVFTSIEDRVNSVIESIENVPVLGEIFLAMEVPVRLTLFPTVITLAAARGENVADFSEREFGRIKRGYVAEARWAEYLGAFIPVVGPIVGSAGALVAGLADGRPLDEIVERMGIATIPGGPLVAMAVRAGVAFSKAILAGQTPRDALNDAVRATVPPGPLRNAYDFASQVAKGERVDDAAIDFAIGLLPLPVELVNLVRAIVLAARSIASGNAVTNFLANAVRALPISSSVANGVTAALVSNDTPTALRNSLRQLGVSEEAALDIVKMSPGLAKGQASTNDVFRLLHDLVSPGPVRSAVDLASLLYSGHVPKEISDGIIKQLPQEAKDAANKAFAVANVYSVAQAREFIRSILPATSNTEKEAANAAFNAGLLLPVALSLQKKAKELLEVYIRDAPDDVKSIARSIQFDPTKNFARPADLSNQLGTPFEPTRRALYYVMLASNASKHKPDTPQDVSRVMSPSYASAEFERYNKLELANEHERVSTTYAALATLGLEPPMSLTAKVITGAIVSSAIGVTGLSLYAWYTEQTFKSTTKQAWSKTKSVARKVKRAVR